MGTKVFIMSVPRETATKISEWRSETSGKKMNKTKVGNCKTKVQALYSPKVGGLTNGLSYKPWMENGKQVEENGKKLTLQDREERKWGLDSGYLSNRSWRVGDSLEADKLTYFQRKSWSLQDGTTVLDLSNFDDAMLYYVAQDSKKVANSEREWLAKKWPEAEFYISIENEDEEMKYAKNKRISTAIAKLADPKISVTKKSMIISILELSSSLNTLSEELIENTLFSFVSAGTNENLNKIEEILNLLTSETGREEFEARYLLRRALESRIVYEKSDTYTWNRAKGPIVLGERYADAITFLTNPKKDTLVEELKDEIKAKLAV